MTKFPSWPGLTGPSTPFYGKIARYALCAAIVFANAQVASAEQRLGYEPTHVEISGTVTLEQHYGPPNYGEEPLTDEKVVAIVLRLDKPIDVIATAHSGPDQDSFFSVSRIQLATLDPRQFDDRVGQHVTIRGTLYEKENGHHYTDVLMFVESQVPSSSKAL